MIFPFTGVSEISLKNDELERDYSSHGVSGCWIEQEQIIYKGEFVAKRRKDIKSNRRYKLSHE